MLWIVSTQIIQIRLILLETLTISNSEIIFAWFLSYLGKFIFGCFFAKTFIGEFSRMIMVISRKFYIDPKSLNSQVKEGQNFDMTENNPSHGHFCALFYHQALLLTGIKVFIYVDTSMRKSGVNPFCLYLYFETLFMVFALYFISDC